MQQETRFDLHMESLPITYFLTTHFLKHANLYILILNWSILATPQETPLEKCSISSWIGLGHIRSVENGEVGGVLKEIPQLDMVVYVSQNESRAAPN